MVQVHLALYKASLDLCSYQSRGDNRFLASCGWPMLSNQRDGNSRATRAESRKIRPCTLEMYSGEASRVGHSSRFSVFIVIAGSEGMICLVQHAALANLGEASNLAGHQPLCRIRIPKAPGELKLFECVAVRRLMLPASSNSWNPSPGHRSETPEFVLEVQHT